MAAQPCAYLYVIPTFVSSQNAIAASNALEADKSSKKGKIQTGTANTKSSENDGHEKVMEAFSTHIEHSLRRHLIESPDARRNPLHNTTLGAIVGWCEEWRRGGQASNDTQVIPISPQQRNKFSLSLFISAVAAVKGASLAGSKKDSQQASQLVFQKTRRAPFLPMYIRAEIPALRLAYGAICRNVRLHAKELVPKANTPLKAPTSGHATKADDTPSSTPQGRVLSPHPPLGASIASAGASIGSPSAVPTGGSTPRRYIMSASQNVSLTSVNVSVGDTPMSKLQQSKLGENGKNLGRSTGLLSKSSSLAPTNPYQSAASALHKRLKLDIVNSEIYHTSINADSSLAKPFLYQNEEKTKFISSIPNRPTSANVEATTNQASTREEFLPTTEPTNPKSEDAPSSPLSHEQLSNGNSATAVEDLQTVPAKTHFSESPSTSLAEYLTELLPPTIYPPAVLGGSMTSGSSTRPLDWHVTITITLTS